MIVVIGAGIVGLHTARALREKGHDVFVLEKEPFLAEHTSGRNSGVIHAGVFYSPGSFKETACIEGNRKTYEWVQKLEVPFRPCGKWVVPENHTEEDLEIFFEKIRALPVPPPQKVSKAELREREPALRPSSAIFVPSTGLVDAAGYVKALARYLEINGVSVILNCEVTGIEKNRLETTRGPIDFDGCVNAAGLNADRIARMAGFNDYEVKPCRGDYYVLNQKTVTRPVYHLPYKDSPGLGIHLTPTLDGQVLLGPNAFFIEEKENYRHRSSREMFEKAARFYLPDLGSLNLSVGYSGNRPKLYRRGEPEKDFVIKKDGNVLHLLGIESPGLTAAPFLAEKAATLVL